MHPTAFCSIRARSFRTEALQDDATAGDLSELMLRELQHVAVDRRDQLLRWRREPVNLIEQGLRRNGTSQEILHQPWRIALGSVAQQVLL
jgi:hypothetical protein